MNRRSFLQTLTAVIVAPLVMGAAPAAPTAPAPVLTGYGPIPLTRGDIIQIAGIYDTHPVTGRSTGYLKHFVVTEDTTDSWSVEVHPPLSPYVNRVNRMHVRPLFVGDTRDVSVDYSGWNPV